MFGQCGERTVLENETGIITAGLLTFLNMLIEHSGLLR